MPLPFRVVRTAQARLRAVLPTSIYDRFRRLWRTVRLGLPLALVARGYDGVPGRIHNEDYMLAGPSAQDVGRYVEVGQSALGNVAAALTAAGRSFDDVRACLDFACGYGRVLRWLATRIPPDRITASDIDRQAVRFCAREFGVRPLLSQREFGQLRFPETYDLIWVGSLLTHLPPQAGAQLLGALADALTPGGVLVFTTQGQDCLARLAFYGAEFAAQEAAFRQGLAADGAYFAPYRSGEGLGIALYRRDHLRQTLAELFGDQLQLVRFAPAGWDEHQDVWAYQRR